MKNITNKNDSLIDVLTEDSIINEAKKFIRDNEKSICQCRECACCLTDDEIISIIDYYTNNYDRRIRSVQELNEDGRPIIYAYFRNCEDLGKYVVDDIKGAILMNDVICDMDGDTLDCILQQCFDYESFGSGLLYEGAGTYVELSSNLIVEYI